MSSTPDYEKEVKLQAQTRRTTVEFINIVNDLWYDKSIELVLFRNTLVDKRANEVLNLINYAKEFVNKTITVRKIMQGIGIERIFLIHSPKIASMEILRSSKVRRSKLYYLRNLKGKASRLKQTFK